MARVNDLSGNRFDRLTVILRAPENDKHGSARWECICDCGSVVIIPSGNLKYGRTRSCGCLQKEAVTKHGFSDLPEYKVWSGIKQRCYNENHDRYEEWGGRGITMCEEWKESFEAFYQDMGPRPSDEHSIDRRDNDKGYSKENCRWATDIEQSNNRRNAKLYLHNGKYKTLPEWSRELGIPYTKTYRRLLAGWSFEKAIQ